MKSRAKVETYEAGPSKGRTFLEVGGGRHEFQQRRSKVRDAVVDSSCANLCALLAAICHASNRSGRYAHVVHIQWLGTRCHQVQPACEEHSMRDCILTNVCTCRGSEGGSIDYSILAKAG